MLNFLHSLFVRIISFGTIIKHLKLEGPRGVIDFNNSYNRTSYDHYIWNNESTNQQHPQRSIYAKSSMAWWSYQNVGVLLNSLKSFLPRARIRIWKRFSKISEIAFPTDFHSLRRIETLEPLFELVDRAVEWLKSNTYNTVIVKWETKAWGEIPADFGRK